MGNACGPARRASRAMLIVASAGSASLVTAALAQDCPDGGKSGYSLFDPTPSCLMRGFSTDRPGNAASPFTVDAGHVQVETGLWSYGWDHWSPDASTTRSTSLFSTNLKLGITNWAELDAILPLYNSQVMRSPGAGGRSAGQGFGDVHLGGKVNLFGNDASDDEGLGLLGYVRLPTAASGVGDRRVELNLGAPYVVSAPADVSVTIEPMLGLLRDMQKPGYHGDYALAVNASHAVPGVDGLSAQIGVTLDRQGDHNSAEQDVLAPAFQWLIGKSLQLDGGVFIGLNRGATDWSPYGGISFRF